MDQVKALENVKIVQVRFEHFHTVAVFKSCIKFYIMTLLFAGSHWGLALFSRRCWWVCICLG